MATVGLALGKDTDPTMIEHMSFDLGATATRADAIIKAKALASAWFGGTAHALTSMNVNATSSGYSVQVTASAT